MKHRDIAIAITAIIVVALLAYGVMGLASSRGESEYTGHVVDVVEDKGVVFRPTWANMKTSPRSSDIQQYCIHPDDEERLEEEFYAAMEGGERVTVTYSRPLWVSPSECPQDTSIIRDIRPANATGAG